MSLAVYGLSTVEGVAVPMQCMLVFVDEAVAKYETKDPSACQCQSSKSPPASDRWSFTIWITSGAHISPVFQDGMVGEAYTSGTELD